MDHSARKSYFQIFRSTGIIAGASVFTILAGILKTKVLASLLGPMGIGLFGIYYSILSTAGALAACGLSMSGVRQIAEANGLGDARRVATTRTALQWATMALALVGTGVFFLFRDQISFWTFGDRQHSTAIAILSLGLLPLVVGGAQGAILNGLRRIGDLARRNVISAAIVTVVSIALAFSLRSQSVVYIVILTSLPNLFLGFYYLGKIKMDPARMTDPDVRAQVPHLFRLGFVFLSTGFMIYGTQFLVRLIINRQLGLESIGHFHAAWTISVLYVGFVLDAMLKDFYPRLTAISTDHEEMTKVVNHQTEIALLISGPIIIGMLTFSPLVITLLYSPQFAPAYPILKWQVVGTLFQVASWPLGFVILAKGFGKTFFFTELLWNVSFITGVLVGLSAFGLVGTGISFLASWVLYGIVVHSLARKFIGFQYTRKNRLTLAALSFVLFLILALSYLNPILCYLTGGIATLLAAALSIRSFLDILGPEKGGQLREALLATVARVKAILARFFPSHRGPA